MLNNKILGLLGLATRAGKIAFGTESVTQVIEKRKAKLIIVAEDSSDRTKNNFKTLCENKDIPIRIFSNIDEISNKIGKFNIAVVAILDSNFSKEIVKCIDGGDVIG